MGTDAMNVERMDVERFDYVTQRDPQLRGLVLLPLSALFLLSAAWRLGLYRLPGDEQPHVPGRWFGVGFLLALAVSWAIRGWYNWKFGTMRQPVAHSQVIRIVAVAICLPFVASMSGMINVTLAPAFVAMVMAGVGLHHYPLRRHYLLAAAVLLAFALLRTFGMPPGALHIALSDLTISAVLAIVGVGDHWLYVSACNEVPARV